MRVTVECPCDGPVEVTLADLQLIVVCSGSDVRVTYRCPLCGRDIRVTSEPGPHFARWLLSTLAEAAGEAEEQERIAERSAEAHLEYFRRELALADTVDAMLALIDAGDAR